MEKKPPRLYVALASGIKIKRLDNDFLLFTRDDKIFYASTASLGSRTDVKLPKIHEHENVELSLWRTPNGATVQITRKDVPVWRMDGRGFSYIGDISLELPTGYAFDGEEPVGKGSRYTLLRFKEEGEPTIHIRKDLVHAICDMPNSHWVYTSLP